MKLSACHTDFVGNLLLCKPSQAAVKADFSTNGGVSIQRLVHGCISRFL
jgi:hypothetical protein